MMKVIGTVPDEAKRLVSAIQRNDGDCEGWLNSYNKSPYNFTWYGYRMIVETLHTSYGVIGYSITYRGYEVRVDNEMRRIEILDE